MMVYCLFCGKSQEEVKKIIAGNNAFICNECVELAQEIIREELGWGKVFKVFWLEVPKPIELLNILNHYVIGQISQTCLGSGQSLQTHHFHDTREESKMICRSNILVIGPTGSGKLSWAQTLAKSLNVPAIADNSSDWGWAWVRKYLKLCRLVDQHQNVQSVTIYVDEIDKIAKKSENVFITRRFWVKGCSEPFSRLGQRNCFSVPPSYGRTQNIHNNKRWFRWIPRISPLS